MRTKVTRLCLWVGLCTAIILSVALPASSQRAPTATDSLAQASPTKQAPPAPVVDSSVQASPVSSAHKGDAFIPPHTALHLRLTSDIDSGRLKNGQTVHATLAAPVPLSPHGVLSAGTPAVLTVVETLPAGRLYSAGEFSLQMLSAGNIPVSTDTLTFRGKAGHKDLPDSAPAMGTDAGLRAGASLLFHVLPAPTAASGPPRTTTTSPGSVDGVTTGGPPASGSRPAGSAESR